MGESSSGPFDYKEETMEFGKMASRSVKRLALVRDSENGDTCLREINAYPFKAISDDGEEFELCAHKYLGTDTKGWVVSDLALSGLQITISPKPTREKAYQDFVNGGTMPRTALKCLHEMQQPRNVNYKLMRRYEDLREDWAKGRK